MKKFKGLMGVSGLVGLLGWGALAISAAGCGSSTAADGKHPGNPAAYADRQQNGIDNACSPAFIEEYNALITAVHSVEDNYNDLVKVKTKVQAFKTQYAGVKCVAIDDKQNQNVTIDVDSKATDAITALDRTIAAHGQAGTL